MNRFTLLRYLLQQSGALTSDKCLLDADVSKLLKILEMSGNVSGLSNDVLLSLIQFVENEINTKNADLRNLYKMLIDEKTRRGL
jgi:transcriptional regulator of aromatic amino acid metabolism